MGAATTSLSIRNTSLTKHQRATQCSRLRNLETLDGIPVLPNAPEIPHIADEIMSIGVLPAKAQVDALHIAAVAHHRIQYLLTWNCRHIANAKILPRIHAVLADLGVPIPIICTPEEMLGDGTGND